MGLKLNGATSGSIELDVPDNIGSDLNITIPGAAGTLDRLERAGNILQVVTASTDTEVSIITRTSTDTGLSANITMSSASNRVLVIIDQAMRLTRQGNSQGGGISVLRDATTIHQPLTDGNSDFQYWFALAGSGATLVDQFDRKSIIMFDTPGSGTHTYKTQARPYWIGNPTSDSNAFLAQPDQPVGASLFKSTSYITLLEVAA